MKRALPGQVLGLIVAVSAVASAQAPNSYSPPRLVNSVLPSEPGAMVAGGGEVLIEFIVDERGTVTRPVIVRSTPPYTQMVLEAVTKWRFEPARATDERGMPRLTEAPLSVSALYRSPTMFNNPTLGEPPRDLTRPSGDVAYAVNLVSPAFPPQALFGSVLLYEVALNETGAVITTRGVASTPGFDSVARDALSKMRFRGGTYRARPVPSMTYVLFGFRPPVVSSMR
jgi:TonB family protein